MGTRMRLEAASGAVAVLAVSLKELATACDNSLVLELQQAKHEIFGDGLFLLVERERAGILTSDSIEFGVGIVDHAINPCTLLH